MVKLKQVFRWHKWAGLGFGVILFILGLSGFFLNHDNFDFLWDWEVGNSYLPESFKSDPARMVEVYRTVPDKPAIRFSGSRKGLFVSNNGGESFKLSLPQQTLALEPNRQQSKDDYSTVFAATTNGVYRSSTFGETWDQASLNGQVVTSISVDDGIVYAVIDKRKLVRLDPKTGQHSDVILPAIPSEIYPDKVSLSRLTRDLHYGRGLFSGDSSLYINDATGFLMVFLGLGGLIIYLLVRRIRKKSPVNRSTFNGLVRTHSNVFVLFMFIPILIILITGVLLDHSTLLRNFMKSTQFSIQVLPPVYRDLSTDIWGVDVDGSRILISNRLGVFERMDKNPWRLASKGFGYRIKRIDDAVYISGMGSPNRLYKNGQWSVLKKTPHMPRDFYVENGEIQFFSNRAPEPPPLPISETTSVYEIMLALHDGRLFNTNGVFINDAASAAGILLFITGFIKWRRHRQVRLRRKMLGSRKFI